MHIKYKLTLPEINCSCDPFLKIEMLSAFTVSFCRLQNTSLQCYRDQGRCLHEYFCKHRKAPVVLARNLMLLLFPANLTEVSMLWILPVPFETIQNTTLCLRGGGVFVAQISPKRQCCSSIDTLHWVRVVILGEQVCYWLHHKLKVKEKQPEKGKLMKWPHLKTGKLKDLAFMGSAL